MTVPADQQALVSVVTGQSQLTTDSKGNAHIHVEFADPNKLGVASVTVTAMKPNCTSSCDVGSISGSLPETTTLDANITTSVSAAAAAPALKKSQADTGITGAGSVVSGNPLEGGHGLQLVTSPEDPTHYSAISRESWSAENSMVLQGAKAATTTDLVRPHGKVVVTSVKSDQ